MYKISEFSKITKLTVKTLRYYDEEGILPPTYRNKDNSYRYYDEEDYRKAQLISLLRNMEFTVAEIKDVLNQCETESDLIYFLQEKKNQVEQSIEAKRTLIKRISLHIKPIVKEEINMDYQVVEKEMPSVIVAAVRFKGKYADIGRHVGTIYKAIKNNGSGYPFSLYYDSEYKEEADIEICVPLKKAMEDKAFECKRLPAIKAVCTTHKGGYDALSYAYKALLDYSHEKKLSLSAPSREVYLKGPGMVFRGNENNFITEIMIPFEEE